jgi:hypothetical protein
MNRESEGYSQDINECRCDKRLKTKDEESTHLGDTGLHGELEHLTIKTRLLDEKFPSVMGEYGLCVRSWLGRHPAKIEITRSSGGSSHHTKSFFFYKNHDFSRYPRRVHTSWYPCRESTSGPRRVTPLSSTRHHLELQWYHFSEVETGGAQL